MSKRKTNAQLIDEVAELKALINQMVSIGDIENYARSFIEPHKIEVYGSSTNNLDRIPNWLYLIFEVVRVKGRDSVSGELDHIKNHLNYITHQRQMELSYEEGKHVGMQEYDKK